MIVVTGAAGFIGCNILKTLNTQGRTDILVVADLRDGKKYRNLAMAQFADYMDPMTFLNTVQSDREFAKKIEVIFHQGACAVTTEWDGHYMMENNYTYSKTLLDVCLRDNISFIYASSAAVYGANSVFKECDSMQMPLNVYGYSKWQFDQYVLQQLKTARSQIFGLRYFNVYGPHEQHKANMVSVVYQFIRQLLKQNSISIFSDIDGYAAGEQSRDFVFIDDVVNVNLWCWQHPEKSGIVNVGSGQARTFNDVANTLVSLHQQGDVTYTPIPDSLKSAYQCFTQADLTVLRQLGYADEFTSLEDGLKQYYDWCLSSGNIIFDTPHPVPLPQGERGPVI